MSAIQFSVKGQEIYSYSNQLPLVADLSIGFVKVKFNFSSDWSDLEKVAQFTQGGTTVFTEQDEDGTYIGSMAFVESQTNPNFNSIRLSLGVIDDTSILTINEEIP